MSEQAGREGPAIEIGICRECGRPALCLASDTATVIACLEPADVRAIAAQLNARADEVELERAGRLN